MKNELNQIQGYVTIQIICQSVLTKLLKYAETFCQPE